ncbi:MAG: dienelactone hydrolase family protein [Bdellovibrionaceae bacterium]|nr:dienelactone hydrolase family protein [Pseudobdellovibrionaceae bacterium]
MFKLSYTKLVFGSFLVYILFALTPQKSFGDTSPEKIQIGKSKSRALWTKANVKVGTKTPAVILIPGSGPNGPEEMMPAKLTEDGKPHSLFQQISEPFVGQNFNVLALGKPGIEFFSRWDDKGWFDLKALFYDQNLYKKTSWSALIDNLAAGIAFLKKQPTVDSNRIYILGHSEGTQIASDYAKRDSSIAGYILLGYSGQNIKKILEWQMVQRPMDHFIETDIDPKGRGYVTKADAKSWPSPILLDDAEFVWPWKENSDQLSHADIEKYLRESTKIDSILQKCKDSAFYGAVCDRSDFYSETANINAPIYIFTGKLDLQTPVSEAIALKDACDKAGKKDCYLNIIPDVGHGFSAPRGPRRHPLADLTVGPVNDKTISELNILASKLKESSSR